MLVGFRPSVSSARRNQLERLVGARWRHPLEFAGDATRAARRLTHRLGTSVVLGVARGRVAATVALLRRERRWIRFAEPDYEQQASGVITPNDPSFPLQWGSLNTGQEVAGISGTPGADDGAAKAWRLSTGTVRS